MLENPYRAQESMGSVRAIKPSRNMKANALSLGMCLFTWLHSLHFYFLCAYGFDLVTSSIM